MFKLMLGFISGVILLYFSGDLINSSKESLNYCDDFSLCVVSLSFLLLILSHLKASGKWLTTVLIILFFLLGFIYALTEKSKVQLAIIPDVYQQKTIHLKAYLCGLPRKSSSGHSAEFCILSIESSEGEQLLGAGLRARLRWTEEKIDESIYGIHQYAVQAKRPRAQANFVGPSFENVFIYKGIILDGRIEQRLSELELKSLPLFNQLEYKLHQFRFYLKRHAEGYLSNIDQSGVVCALLLGDKSGLSRDDVNSLMSTGTLHLLAISGLHVGLVMVALLSVLPKSMLGFISSALLGGIYVLIVGASPSAQRAWIMTVCLLVYFSGYFRASRWQVFILALFVVLLIDPLAAFNFGFWFSFLCVGIIFLLIEWSSISFKPLFLMIYFQLGISLALVPLTSILGMKHGLESLLANFLAIPWVSLFILPLTLIWYFSTYVSENVSTVLLKTLNVAIELLMGYLDALSGISLPMTIDHHFLVIFLFVLVCFGLLFLLRFRLVFIIASLAISLALIYPNRFNESEDELIVFDVGQGLAMALKSQNEVLLYDLGLAYESGSSVQSIILPYLRSDQKYTELTGLVISHGDSDHAGDVKTLINHFYPHFFWSGQPERLVASSVNICLAGMRSQVGEIELEVLYPFSVEGAGSTSSNNQSCVLKVNFAGKTFLLMGDLEGNAEYELVRRYRDYLQADVLIAGHHGAAKSSSYALLKHVQPEYVVFSAGYLNKFGHPSEEVRQRLNSFDLVSLNTAETGALRFRLSSKSELMLDQARK